MLFVGILCVAGLFYHFHCFRFTCRLLTIEKMVKSTNQDKNGTTRKLKAGFVCEDDNAPL